MEFYRESMLGKQVILLRDVKAERGLRSETTPAAASLSPARQVRVHQHGYQIVLIIGYPN